MAPPPMTTQLTSSLQAVTTSLCLLTYLLTVTGFPPYTSAAAAARPSTRSVGSLPHQNNHPHPHPHPHRHPRETDPGRDYHHPSSPAKDGTSPGYGVLLDAGSSSTKVKVYSYKAASSSPVPHVRLERSDRVKPGLGNFVGSSGDELKNYLVEVLGHATAEVPSDLHASTPVYVMATAGLRVLSADDARDLLGAVQGVMSNTTLNPLLFHAHHLSILSGEEEAVYAWLAVNYLRGFFDPLSSLTESVGVLEMGGGSMQVAFLPDAPLYQEEFQMYVGRSRFDLYAQTYLSYGSNYLTGQVRRQLVASQGKEEEDGEGEKVLYSPCMLSDDTDTFELKEEGTSYQVRGTGNASHCEEVLSSLLSPVDSILCSPSPCAIGDTYQPAVGQHKFYAISAFLYAPKNLKAVSEDGVLNITLLRHHARDYCNLTVAQAVKQTGTKAKFASNDCLMGLYIPLLLTSALGFEPHSRTITVASKINGTKIDWALGAMVQHLSMTFMSDPCPHGHDQSQTAVVADKTITLSSGSRPLPSALTFISLWALVLGCMRLLWQ